MREKEREYHVQENLYANTQRLCQSKQQIWDCENLKRNRMIRSRFPLVYLFLIKRLWWQVGYCYHMLLHNIRNDSFLMKKTCNVIPIFTMQLREKRKVHDSLWPCHTKILKELFLCRCCCVQDSLAVPQL